MPKEKKQIEHAKPKDFFYEISATITILLCLVLLSELGSIGIILKKLFKIVFGDFYFVIVIYLIIHGIIALVKQKWFDIRSLRFNGFLLFIIFLLMLTHLNFLDLYAISSDRVLASSLAIYKEALIGKSNLSSFGGGLIGAIFSQIFIVLFSRIGAVIFGVIFIILSLSMMTNWNFKTLIYGSNIVFKKIKGVWLKIYRYFANINYPSKKERQIKRNFILNLNLLNEVRNNSNDILQSKISYEEKQLLINFFYQNNCYINGEKTCCGYTYTRYIFLGNFKSIANFNYEKIFNRKAISYLESDKLIIEVSNRLKKILCLKTLLLMNLVEKIPIGVEINDSVIYFKPLENEHLLLSGDYQSGIKTFIRSFIITLIYRLRDNFNLIVCDYYDEFNDLKYLPNLLYPINKHVEQFETLLDELTIELEKRLNIMSKYNVNNYLELNKVLDDESIESIKPIFFIVNNIEAIYKSKYALDQKLLYFFKFAHKAGIHLLIISRKGGLSKSLISNCKTKMIFKSSTIEQSFELLDNAYGCYLQGNGDCLITNNLLIYHVQLPYLAKDDYQRVINKFILN